MSIFEKFPYFNEKIWTALIGGASILGIFLAGHQIGASGLDRRASEILQASEQQISFAKETASRDISSAQDLANQEIARARIDVERRLADGERRFSSNLDAESKAFDERFAAMAQSFETQMSDVRRQQSLVVENLKEKHLKELAETRTEASQQAALEVRLQNLNSQQQLKQLSMLVAIMTNPSIENFVAPQINEIVRQVSLTVPEKNLEEARLQLPENVRLEPEQRCVQNGEFAMMGVGAKFTDCGKNIVVVLVATQPSYAIFAVDGVRESVTLGTKRSYSSANCTLFFSNYSTVNGERFANVSMRCEN